ncbi:glycosyl transferase family protein [Glaciecola siphonariae]|uniref:Glycosyl transferase family protein n=1 Tax=Glaciecola siphonariae TaxID=521012 RepID=A0ABV9LVP9_9ALTE
MNILAMQEITQETMQESMQETTQDTRLTQSDAVAEFAGYIKIIGRGQRTSSSLTQAQAYRAMLLLLNELILPEQEGAFLMLLRLKEESIDEIAGFTQACRDTAVSAYQTLNVDLDISAYAGKRRQLPWFMLAIAVLVQNNVRVLLHSSEEPHSKRFYAKHFLSQLGIDACQSPTEAAKQLEQAKFCFVELKQLHPKLYRILQLREIFGLRSCANTLARLLNPSRALYSMQGVHHRHVDTRHMEVSQRLNDANTLCFRGEGGEPEIKPEVDTLLCLNRGQRMAQAIIPAAGQWAIKEKAFSAAQAIKLFKGTSMHKYGENAVLDTLSAALVLLHDITPFEAANLAADQWNRRDKRKCFVNLEEKS